MRHEHIVQYDMIPLAGMHIYTRGHPPTHMLIVNVVVVIIVVIVVVVEVV